MRIADVQILFHAIDPTPGFQTAPARWIEEWLDAGAQPVSDSEVRRDLFAELVAASERSLRNSIDDAHLAAVAISRGATLASFHGGFRSFVPHGLRWERLG